jgi:hypothetical protein
MRRILFLLLLCPFVSYGQKVSGHLQADFRYQDTLGFGYGGGAGVRYRVARLLQVGAQASAIKFKDLTDTYYPVVLTARVKIPVRIKLKPFVQGEAGLGLYNYSHDVTATQYKEKGKFTYGGSIGFIGKGVRLAKPYFSVGFYGADIERTEVSSTINKKTSLSYNGFFLRLGIEIL